MEDAEAAAKLAAFEAKLNQGIT
eukprot:SAG11_NODE_32439_length_283_cov_1.369565_1_plen_22_part_10